MNLKSLCFFYQCPAVLLWNPYPPLIYIDFEVHQSYSERTEVWLPESDTVWQIRFQIDWHRQQCEMTLHNGFDGVGGPTQFSGHCLNIG